MKDTPSPLLRAPTQHFRLQRSQIGRILSSLGPPLHHSYLRRATSGRETGEHETEPFKARHEHRPAARRIVETRLDALEANGFGRAHGTQPFSLDALRLLQHALVPQQERFLA